MSLGQDFRELMMQAASALEPNVINEQMVSRVAQQLDQLNGVEALAGHIDPASGSINDLHAGTARLNSGGIKIDGDGTFAVFTGAQVYNKEAVSDGDIVFGSNQADQANILWDKSSGELIFRGGTTRHLYINVDGSLRIVNSASTRGLVFEDNAGGIGGYISADAVNNMKIAVLSTAQGLQIQGSMGGYISLVTPYPHGLLNQLYVSAKWPYNSSYSPNGVGTSQFSEYLSHAVVLLNHSRSAATTLNKGAGGLFAMVNTIGTTISTASVGSSITVPAEVAIWAATSAGNETYFNNGKWDIDFAIYGTTNKVFGVDAAENLPLLTTQSKTSAASGSGGMFATDGNYLYVHDSTEWRRAALSTF